VDDILGRALLDYHCGDRASRFQWERSDGIRVDQRLDIYYDGFHDLERWALDHLRSAVLDIGCGAGKHALECRRRGFQCFGYDISPRAIEVCRRRGLSALAVADAFACGLPDAVFDCVTLFSNNLSIGGTVEGVRALLGEAARVARPGARMISINRDAAAGRDAADRAYRAANQRAGRPSGQISHARLLQGRGRALVRLALRLPGRAPRLGAG
jgi:SAM-dependent methyltransferase